MGDVAHPAGAAGEPSSQAGRLLVLASPAGFERFFDDLSQIPPEQTDARTALMNRYGYVLLGRAIGAQGQR